MAKKLASGGVVVEVSAPAIIGDDGGPEYIIPTEKAKTTEELICKAAEPLTITCGNKLLFHGKGVKQIDVHFAGD